MESSLARDKSRRWFHGLLMKSGTKRTNMVNLATALHREALAMQLHTTPGWRSRVFQSIERWPDSMQLWAEWERIYADIAQPNRAALARQFYEDRQAAMQGGCKLLWPEEEDLYTLMCMRVESGHGAFEREKQNVPVNPEQCEWPEEYFSDLIWFERWPADLQLRTLALDPSKGVDARHGDYSAYVMLGVDRTGIIYVEADLARRPTPQMVSDGVELCRRFQPDVLGVEVNQFQELLADDFVSEFARQGLLSLPIHAIENRVNKAVRIRRLGAQLSGRRMRFKSGSPSTRMLVEQLREFPLSSHDDGPDALEMALRLASEWLSRMQFNDGLGHSLASVI